MSKFFFALSFLITLQLGCSEPEAEAPLATPKIALAAGTAEQTLMNEAKGIHKSALTLDAHADIELPGQPSSYVGPDGLSKVAPAKMRAGGLDAVVMAIAVGPRPRTTEGYASALNTAQEELAAVTALAADPANNAVIATSVEELLAAHENEQLALLLGMQNALILGTDLTLLDSFYDQGVRVFALTHMGHNDFADSSRTIMVGDTGRREAPAEHGGLSDLGVAAVKRIGARGGVIDISQLSKQAALQVMQLSATPVIASHSNVRALTDVSRNLSDEELDRIAATGGVVHVAPFRGYLFDSSNPELDAGIRAVRRQSGVDEDYLYPFELYWEIDDDAVKANFLTQINELLGPIDLEIMLNHIDYIVQRIGVDHVGIGTDFNHGSGIINYQDASDSMNVTLGLLQRGYSATDIEKIWGGNFLRVWQAAQEAAREG